MVAPVDADVLIVSIALKLAEKCGNSKVAIICEDTDFLLLLVAAANLECDVLLVKIGKRSEKEQVYSVDYILRNYKETSEGYVHMFCLSMQ